MKIYVFTVFAAALLFSGDVSGKDKKVVKPQTAVRAVKPIRNISPAKCRNLEIALKRVRQPAPHPNGATANSGAAAGLLASDKNDDLRQPSDARSRLREALDKKAKSGS
jgi:hypothetical protein